MLAIQRDKFNAYHAEDFDKYYLVSYLLNYSMVQSPS